MAGPEPHLSETLSPAARRSDATPSRAAPPSKSNVTHADDRSGPILNAMTVDVEEHFQVSGFEGSVRREDWESHPSRVSENTGRLLDLFDEVGIRATFFVLGWLGERHPALVRRIADRGHEIASHGYSHRLAYSQAQEEFRSETERSKRILEDASGRAIAGYRAASFSIDRRNLWALDVLAETGFTYDSSLFPVRHDRYGLPGAPRHPYRVRTRSGAQLTEIPPSTLRFRNTVLPVAGGGYLRLYPLALTSWAIARLERERLPAVVYVHPWETDPEQPRIDAPLMSRMRHYVGIDGTVSKLRRLATRFRFASMAEVVARCGPLPEIPLA
jgi:polysaccharide deacetylase family protein (PEP-CTERM system associated)